MILRSVDYLYYNYKLILLVVHTVTGFPQILDLIKARD